MSFCRNARGAALAATPTAFSKPDYVRARDLPKLIGLWPAEIADTSRSGTARLIAKLKRALREERQRGLAGHWSYDLARHSQLLEAHRREVAGAANDRPARPA